MIICCSADNIELNPSTNPLVKLVSFKEYSKHYGPSCNTPSSLLQMFYLFFTMELLGTIVTETNRFASICLKEAYESWDKAVVEPPVRYGGIYLTTFVCNLNCTCTEVNSMNLIPTQAKLIDDVYKAFKILLIMPHGATNMTSEHSFSTLRRIKIIYVIVVLAVTSLPQSHA